MCNWMDTSHYFWVAFNVRLLITNDLSHPSLKVERFWDTLENIMSKGFEIKLNNVYKRNNVIDILQFLHGLSRTRSNLVLE